MDQLYLTHPHLAPHLSAFGENGALGESLRWLRDLQIRWLDKKDAEAKKIQSAVIDFINGAKLLPHGARIYGVTSEQVRIVDGFGSQVAVQEMSDGYRSILSMTFGLMRLLFSISEVKKRLLHLIITLHGSFFPTIRNVYCL